MKIENIAGQLMIIGFKGHRIEEVEELIKDIKPAGLVFQSHNIISPEQVKKLISELQSLARELGLPEFFITITEEGGLISRFKYGSVPPTPTPMAVGVTRNPKYARKLGEVIGGYLKSMGFNWDFAPCLDINSNPFNPVIGLRSFGEEASLVSEMGVEFIKGLESKGVIATGKHFPGHGDTLVDSHLDLPVLNYEEEFLMKREFQPFVKAIKSGLKTIMTAHIALPKIDKSMLPATLSKKIINGILRKKLGFRGVVITDSLLMKAVYDRFEVKDIVKLSLEAGCDILLMSYNKDFIYEVKDSIIELAEKNVLDLKGMKESLKRIDNLRKSLQQTPIERKVSNLEEVFKESVKILRDNRKTIPLRTGVSIQLLLPKFKSLIPVSYQDVVNEFINSLKKSFKIVGVVTYDVKDLNVDKVLCELREAQVVVIGVYNAFINRKQIELVNKVIEKYPKHIVISLKEPYDYLVLDKVETLIATYGYLPPTIHSLSSLLKHKCN